MKNLLLGTILAVTTAFTASAEPFYQNTVGNWFVFGDPGDEVLSPACVISYTWRDGSEFQLIYDLYHRSLDIWFENFDWDIADEANLYYSMDMVIIGTGDNLISGEMEYFLEDKNSIYLYGVEPTGTFVDAFASMQELRFIMPGNIPNAYLSLEGSRDATRLFLNCITIGDNMEFEDFQEPLGQAL